MTASVALGLLVGGAFAALLDAVAEQRSSARLARQSHQVLSAANHLERLVVDLETGQRGFVLTGQERFLAPWRAARATIPRTGQEMVRYVTGAGQRRAAGEIVAAIAAYQSDYSVPLIRAARRGAAFVRSDAEAEDGKRRLDAIRRQFERFTTSERALSGARLQRAEHDARDATLIAAAGLTVSTILIAAFTAYITRAVVSPVRNVAETARRLAAGELGARLPERGIAELGDLERAFNAMGRSLERNRDALAWNAREQAALRRVATLVAEGEPPARLFGAVAEELGGLVDATSVAVLRFEANEHAEVVARWGAADPGREIGSWAQVEDIAATGSAVTAPIVVEGRVWGVLEAMGAAAETRQELQARMTSFTDLVATAIANAQSRDALTASRARVVATADETRRRIERDLHDGAQQRLVHTVITLKLAQTALREGDPEAHQLVGEALDHAEQATAALRELVHGMLPGALSRGGLRPALDGLAERVAVPVALEVTSERFDPRLEATAYFIVAEALTNVAKHAQASSAAVRVEVVDSDLEVEVRDDGVGGARVGDNTGLLGLQDRAAALDGTLEVWSPPGGGTVVAARLPIAG